MAANRHQHIGLLLAGIEDQLKQLRFWQDTLPSAEAFASDLPFCYDSLEFPQWLQFIFLQKMHKLVLHTLALPETCAIAPYAEEYFKSVDADTQTLLAHLAEIDKLLTEN